MPVISRRSVFSLFPLLILAFLFTVSISAQEAEEGGLKPIPGWAQSEIDLTLARFQEWKGNDEVVAVPLVSDVHSEPRPDPTVNGDPEEPDWSDAKNHIYIAQRAAALFGADFMVDLGDIGMNSGKPDSVYWRIAAQMRICFVQKENGGKHTALNAAHPHVHGKYVLILDSDDTLTDDAVAVVLECWSRWENHSEVGIVTLLKGKDREHPNCYGAQENVPVDIMSGKRIRPVSNDACEVIRTEVFLQYPFPVFPGETFLSEGALWNRVSFTHKCVYVNRVIYLCDYLAGGLTQSGRAMRIRSPRGGMYTHNLNMSGKSGCKRRVKSGMLYTCYGFFAGQSPLQMHRACDHKWLMWMCLPFGWLLYLFWKKSF